MRKPLIVSLVALLIVLVISLITHVAGLMLFGGAMTNQMKQEVYQESTDFMKDVYQEDARQTYNEYLSSFVKKTDTQLLSWNRMVKYMHQDKLVKVLPYSEQNGQFYKDQGSNAPGIVRYGVKLKAEIQMSGKVKPVTAQIEWVKENGHLKLFLLKVPYEIASNGKMNTIFYSLKHYTTIASQ